MTQRFKPANYPAIYLAGALSVLASNLCMAQGAPSTTTAGPTSESGGDGAAKTQMRLLVGSSPGGGYDTYAFQTAPGLSCRTCRARAHSW